MPPAAATGRRVRLEPEAVVDAAVAVADREGLDALTIRRLAQDLGVTPMALYWHFADKDALLDALGDRMWTEVEAALADQAGGGSADAWETLRATTEAVVGVLRRHPAVAPLVPARVLAGEAGLAVTERTLDVLVAQGLDVREAAELSRWILCGALLLVSEQPGGETGTPGERDAKVAAKRTALAALPADRYPLVKAAADTFTDCDTVDGYYDRGLDLVMAGLRVRLGSALQS